MHTQLPKIVLASSSVFRQQLLNKLQLPFIIDTPDIDETPQPNETIEHLVNRLTLEKAQKIAPNHPNSLIIASDQSAEFNGQAVGKPHTLDKATHQLSQFSGHTVTFHTGLVVLDTRNQTHQQTTDTTLVQFRQLTQQEIADYLAIESPLQCAGSFKSEGLGITLFESISSQDPNALIGLPLIALTGFLKNCGIPMPYRAHKTER